MELDEQTQGNTKKSIEMLLMALGIIFIATNLRAPITSVGPVINEITDYFNLSNIQAGLITTIPLMSFALLSGFAPGISSKIGMEKLLLFSLILLTSGLLIRITGQVYFLFIGAAMVGAAITVGNVIMPAVIKKEFPNHTGIMTGIYAVSMNLTSAMAAGFSIAIGTATGWGWKGSIGVWAIVAILSLLVWIPQVLKRRQQVETPVKPSFKSMMKSRLAWNVTLFMGLQSLLFYCVAAWLPAVLQDWGMSKGDAGWVLSYVQLAQLPITFVGPVIVNRMKDQGILVWITGLLMLAGILLIIFFKSEFIILATILIGVAGGLAFSLAMMFFVLRTKNPAMAASLSGMAQSFGYLIAAAGPPAFGLIYDFTGNWSYSFYLLIIGVGALIYSGVNASKNKFVEQ
ncbi:MFS transporter [Pedobacter sp. ASV1-7]|uniref:CynX/NimT family MFS transporter n=1 Tax=Pedobacter sp. ASV1-7 TaxID=3145237 RepID=UPI0032E86BDB